ncbi:hypothetical protein M427DRAFT_44766 [Gonapodya prolifera JEL478]|uniref:Uncharacterized protein n=1 Tax=Gonapodya prolifera (strain JEL478) TaxID=1344416 RepID=A0A139AEC4_GONPJ|nr:hypothetical protein M427DRAFT_44766 [Gonapodya prolifera JEL478]|eukprot:KXS14773.1 hypothetical protein M427DRAFT_44766 [Gonapodya prolifera JEL478]
MSHFPCAIKSLRHRVVRAPERTRNAYDRKGADTTNQLVLIRNPNVDQSPQSTTTIPQSIGILRAQPLLTARSVPNGGFPTGRSQLPSPASSSLHCSTPIDSFLYNRKWAKFLSRAADKERAVLEGFAAKNGRKTGGQPSGESQLQLGGAFAPGYSSLLDSVIKADDASNRQPCKLSAGTYIKPTTDEIIKEMESIRAIGLINVVGMLVIAAVIVLSGFLKKEYPNLYCAVMANPHQGNDKSIDLLHNVAMVVTVAIAMKWTPKVSSVANASACLAPTQTTLPITHPLDPKTKIFVFVGANTYIGNAPNMLVRSIAVENGIDIHIYSFDSDGRYICPETVVVTSLVDVQETGEGDGTYSTHLNLISNPNQPIKEEVLYHVLHLVSQNNVKVNLDYCAVDMSKSLMQKDGRSEIRTPHGRKCARGRDGKSAPGLDKLGDNTAEEWLTPSEPETVSRTNLTLGRKHAWNADQKLSASKEDKEEVEGPAEQPDMEHESEDKSAVSVSSASASDEDDSTTPLHGKPMSDDVLFGQILVTMWGLGKKSPRFFAPTKQAGTNGWVIVKAGMVGPCPQLSKQPGAPQKKVDEGRKQKTYPRNASRI